MFKAHPSGTAAAFHLFLHQLLGGRQTYGKCKCQCEDQVVVSFDAALERSVVGAKII